MFFNPTLFEFVEHWTHKDRQEAAKICSNLARRYVKWLGSEDAESAILIGTVKAFRRYRSEMIPSNINGYLRHELNQSSSQKQRCCDAITNLETTFVTEVDVDRNIVIFEILKDLKAVLLQSDIELLERAIVNEEVLVGKEKKRYLKVLNRLKELNHG